MGKKTIHSVAFLLSSALIMSSSAAVQAPFEIGTWGNFCKAAVSQTFDDNTNGQTGAGQEAFDAKGFKMTIFTSQAFGPDWNKLKSAFAKGHEIASHSVTHSQNMPDAECPTSQNAVREKVPGEMCVTIAYPYCNIPNPQTQLKKCYIAGRICDNQIANKSPSDMYKISAIIAGNAGVNNSSSFNSKADEAASKNGWLVWLHHGVGNDGHGYSNTDLNALKGHLDYLDANRDKFWTETFGNVARYIKERDAASLTVETSTDNLIKVKLTDNLVDSIYNYPLSIRFPLPEGWDENNVRITQDGEDVEDSIVTVNSKKYVMFKAVPDNGDIIIENGTMVRKNVLTLVSQNRLVLNKSILSFNVDNFSGPVVQATLFDLKGKLIGKYSVNKSGSSVSIPVQTLSNSAVLVKITDGNTTVVSRCLAQ